MASGNYSQPSTQASASEVLKVVVLELHELQTQYKEVNNRIRNLRIAVDALRELGDKTSPGLVEEQDASDRRARRISAEPASAGLVRTSSQSNILRGNPNPDLQRACRIALMETANAVTVDEIYARIVRRKSFSFLDRASAIYAISDELHAMLHQGELRRIDDSRSTTWLRVEPHGNS